MRANLASVMISANSSLVSQLSSYYHAFIYFSESKLWQ